MDVPKYSPCFVSKNVSSIQVSKMPDLEAEKFYHYINNKIVMDEKITDYSDYEIIAQDIELIKYFWKNILEKAALTSFVKHYENMEGLSLIMEKESYLLDVEKMFLSENYEGIKSWVSRNDSLTEYVYEYLEYYGIDIEQLSNSAKNNNMDVIDILLNDGWKAIKHINFYNITI